MYANAPPTKEPNDAATVIGNARFFDATIAGVMKTSGGTNKNIDSQMVKKNTIHEYVGLSDFFNMCSTSFIPIPRG
jgi:hypothetical protein